MKTTRIEAANRNTLWATALVDSLAQQGVSHVVIGAGSRSTPLTMAFAAHPHIEAHSFIDERSAAFFALGIAKTSGHPAALVSTSGTAGANFFPAIIEASTSRVPMIVLTADRPADLRESGANQTIDQLKLFGSQVRWFHEAALPEAHSSQHLLRYVRTLAARAVSASQGELPGPVHLNLPYRPPLEPTPMKGDIADWRADNNLPPSPRIQPGYGTVPSEDQARELITLIEAHPHGLIVCGPGAFKRGEALVQLANVCGYPVLADGLSGLRFGPWFSDDLLLTGYESYIEQLGRIPATLVIQFGDVPTGKQLNAYLEKLPETTERVRVSDTPDWQDDTFRITHVMLADPNALVGWVAEASYDRQPDEDWLKAWTGVETAAGQIAARHLPKLEARVIVATLDTLPEGGNLVVGNSLPVRHLDQFGNPIAKHLHVYANRGASGIDGNISTAVGIALASGRPTALVCGDLTFLHDLGGLLALKRLNIPLIILVINNDGGGIFQRLPVRGFDPPFTEFFQTPHGLTFEHSAAQFSIAYEKVDKSAEIRKAIETALTSQGSAIIEIPSDAKKEETARHALLAEIRTTLGALT
jgi:2-succinyl-5-enolpyruvyl-6-hydroxy-3-cyclohexene-1-carboxylate synthase